jgi:3-hydroxypropanoate dehydrogenase
MAGRIGAECLNQIFLEARTHNKWEDKPVPEELLRQLVDIMKMGPTSANQSPARILFVKSAEAKERLAPHLSEGNRAKTMSAPVCAIIGYDLRFYDHLPKLFPHTNAKSWFEGKPEQHIETSAFRNGTLQGAYFIIAARALGLDTGPMSGFDNAGVDREFFAGASVKSNFLCSLGYGDPSGIFRRSPRFSFEEIAKIL